MLNGGWKIHIIAGGTVSAIRPHLALCAPVFDGKTGYDLASLINERYDNPVFLHTTMMAGDKAFWYEPEEDESIPLPPRRMKTNADVAKLVDEIVEDPTAKILFLPVALCDFDVEILGGMAPNVIAGPTVTYPSGNDQPRLLSSEQHMLLLKRSEKVINRVRKARKDLFLVGFKSTTGATVDEQFEAGLKLLKTSSCNLVFANDLHNKRCMVITPEQVKYAVGTDRDAALRTLVEMAITRADARFTRSTIIPGEPVDWNSDLVPASLRTVVNHLIKRGAYRPFLGATVGHFATKIDNSTFLTSRRRTDFNKIDKVGLVKVETVGDDQVIAHGSKPSVGGQSQRIIFAEHPDTDCIVHAHIQLKQGSKIPVRQQWPFECGSMECGKNTSSGLEQFGNIWAVMLEKHGPNIVFKQNTDPNDVISFIEENFEPEHQTSELS